MSIQDTRLWSAIDNTLERIIFRASWRWPTGLRHAYVATWPLAIIIRLLAGFVLVLALCVLYLTDAAIMYFKSVWRGERPETNSPLS